jgi:hypothetical protein
MVGRANLSFDGSLLSIKLGESCRVLDLVEDFRGFISGSYSEDSKGNYSVSSGDMNFLCGESGYRRGDFEILQTHGLPPSASEEEKNLSFREKNLLVKYLGHLQETVSEDQRLLAS